MLDFKIWHSGNTRVIIKVHGQSDLRKNILYDDVLSIQKKSYDFDNSFKIYSDFYCV